MRSGADEGTLSESGDSLQLSSVNNNYVNLVTGSANSKTLSTGAIRFVSSNKTTGNCGTTFISPHYAVTAAHCVPKDQLVANSTTFSVTQYDTTSLSVTAVNNQATVDGLWPNYAHHSTLTTADGYRTIPYTDCTVTRRCSTNGTDVTKQFGRDNCPFSPDDVDIALIKCPSRPANSTWSAVATSDSGTQNVEVWWFHEIVNMRATETGDTTGPSDGWTHYGSYDGTAANKLINWHYMRSQNGTGPMHQLLPLFSGTWPDGTPYKAVGHNTTDAPTTTMANIPACHGTSGSGVFPRGDSAYLGPDDLAPNFSSLCIPMLIASGQRNAAWMYYIRAEWTRRIEAVSEVQVDRPH